MDIDEINFTIACKLCGCTYPSISNKIWKINGSYLHNYHEDYSKLMEMVEAVINKGYTVMITNTEKNIHFCRIEYSEFTNPVTQIMNADKKHSILLAIYEFAKKLP